MHGRNWLTFGALGLAATLVACSPNSLMKPDCHSCTVEEQEWKEFSWSSLEGKWKGSVENFRNERDQGKKTKVEKPVELSFVPAAKFIQSRNAGACASLPANAMVLNGLLWEQEKGGTREYEAFIPAEEGKVAYGRVAFSKVNGQEHCQFRRLGRVMGKNRLSLPTVSFSDRAQSAGRSLASASPQQEISLEFLRFATLDKPAAFPAGGRKPASVREQERPTLMFRVFKVATSSGGVKAEWQATEEHIYRLWRAE